MGLYNSVVGSVLCCNCSHPIKVEIQFHYGDVRMRVYKIGDEISWPDISLSQHPNFIKAYGIADKDVPCANCGHVNDYEYDIWIINNKIVGFTFMMNYDHYLLHEGDYHNLLE